MAVSNGVRIIKKAEIKPWEWKEAIIADPDDNEFLIEEKLKGQNV